MHTQIEVSVTVNLEVQDFGYTRDVRELLTPQYPLDREILH